MNLIWHSVLAAAMLVFSYPPFSIWPLSLLSFVVLLRPYVLHFEAFGKLSFWKKLGYFSLFMYLTYWGGFYWIAHTLHEFASLNWPLSLLVMAFILAFFSTSFIFASGLALFLNKRFGQKLSKTAQLALFVLIFCIWDFVDPKAFPWSPVKALGADRVLLASVGILKTAGWKILFWLLQFYILYQLPNFKFTKGKARFHILTSLLLVVSLGYLSGLYQIKKLKRDYAETQPVALIQGNVGNYEKKLVHLGIMPTVTNVMGIHQDLIEEAAIVLGQQYLANKKEPWVVWPETGFPGFPLSDKSIAEDLARWMQLTRGLHFVGAYENAPFKYGGFEEVLEFNIVAFFHSKMGYVSHYRKITRMPFGEYIPGEDLWPGAYKYLPVNHFGKGTEHTLLVHPKEEGPVFVPLICYEILKETLVNTFVREAKAKYPTRQIVLVNPSNDSWYGESSEPFQHSLLARWESARLALPMLRSTNTGMSQVIAPWGEVLFSGPRNKGTVIYGELPVKKAVFD